MEYRVVCLARPNGTAGAFKRYAQTVEGPTQRLAEDLAIVALRRQGMDVRVVAQTLQLKGGL